MRILAAEGDSCANSSSFGGDPYPCTVSKALLDALSRFGVRQAFGLSGGAIALFFDALSEAEIETYHARHETGAAFAACEASLASRRPTVVFTTSGPGLLNALTGMTACRWDGAQVILVSGTTNAPQRGRWATQESSSYTLPQDVLYTKGPLFDFALRMESACELPEVIHRLGQGIAGAGGFVAHIGLPVSVQAAPCDVMPRPPAIYASHPHAHPREVAEIAHRLKEQPFVIWLGHGARGAARRVRHLAEVSGAQVICSPRAKGIFPEGHKLFLGVSGLGGHRAVNQLMIQQKPKWALVLGTRLGEATSFWDEDLLPKQGFIHVDLDPEVPGTAYPEAMTWAVHAEIDGFLEELLRYFPVGSDERPFHTRGLAPHPWHRAAPRLMPLRLAGEGPTAGATVRPQALMAVLQRRVVEGSDAIVLSECGNSFAWTTHHLCFDEPGRYRVSTLFGSMGHMCSGVVGAALGAGRRAVAVVGDGSMLMTSEVSTAVQYQVSAIWVVLNDAGYGMCRDGHQALGLTDAHVDFPRVDFVKLARSLGAEGCQVKCEGHLDRAFDQALEASGPFLIDVHIDVREASPLLERFESLIRQGNSKNVAGWEA